MQQPATPWPTAKIRVGVSACLLGENVRYDGRHKRDAYITSTLGEVFELIAVCPEVAIGMGVPRPSIHLVGDASNPRAVGVADPALDVTAALAAYGRRMAAELGDISGYIFKAGSPSCGVQGVAIHGDHAIAARGGGIYARAIIAERPLMPAEEEGRLGDPLLRENFIARVFAYRRWQTLTSTGFTVGKLVEFHAAHKLVLMSHGAMHYAALGRLVAEAASHELTELRERYGSEFMAALRQPATRRRHTDVLQHLMGYLKNHLDRDDKAELAEVIDRYRRGLLLLAAPQTLLQHHFRRFPDAYVARQLYLYPEPAEALLRSSV